MKQAVHNNAQEAKHTMQKKEKCRHDTLETRGRWRNKEVSEKTLVYILYTRTVLPRTPMYSHAYTHSHARTHTHTCALAYIRLSKRCKNIFLHLPAFCGAARCLRAVTTCCNTQQPYRQAHKCVNYNIALLYRIAYAKEEKAGSFC